MAHQLKRVAIYIRVSSADQKMDLQRTELVSFAKARGWTITKIYEDKATGTNDNRPQLKALMKAASAREFDIVAVWKMDRMARSLKNLLNTIQTFEDLGIAFVSFKEAIDLGSSTGKLMLAIIGAFAQFERDIIVDRVTSGLREAKRKGVQLGRPSEIDCAKVIELRKTGHSLSAIAEAIGFSKAGVHKVLKRLA